MAKQVGTAILGTALPTLVHLVVNRVQLCHRRVAVQAAPPITMHHRFPRRLIRLPFLPLFDPSGQ